MGHRPGDKEAAPIEAPAASPLATWTARAGLLLFTGPFWGTPFTVQAMLRAFDTMGVEGGEAPAALGGSIRLALWTSAAGTLVGILGAALILLAFFALRFRAAWFYRWTLFLSVLWCLLAFPVGMIAGLPLAILFYSRKREFG